MIRYKKSITWKGKRKLITLKPEHYQNLMQRFNIESAERMMPGSYQINVRCSLCKEYKDFLCTPKCPFEKFEELGGLENGCLALIHSKVGAFAEVKYGYIRWRADQLPRVTKVLNAIHDWLKSFKRVTT